MCAFSILIYIFCNNFRTKVFLRFLFFFAIFLFILSLRSFAFIFATIRIFLIAKIDCKCFKSRLNVNLLKRNIIQIRMFFLFNLYIKHLFKHKYIF